MSCFYGYKAINATQKTVNKMSNPINNTVFDSRDLREYLEELEDEMVDLYNEYIEDIGEEEEIDTIDEVDFDEEGFIQYADSAEIEHYENVRDFVEELESYGDFDHGETIIHEDYFTDYSKELCEDLGEVSKDLPWYISNHPRS